MDSDPILGVPIRDTTDHVSGRIHHTYGPTAFSALLADGSVRYYSRGSDRFRTNWPTSPSDGAADHGDGP
jgi:hypothetical protein